MIKVAEKVAAGEKFSVANSARGHITIDGLRNMILDLRAQGIYPDSIVLSYRDRLDVNDDLMSMSKTEVLPEDANRKLQIGIIEGVKIGWNRDVENGKCVIIRKQVMPAVATTQ